MLKYIVNNAGLTMLLKFTVNLQNLLKEKKKKENLLNFKAEFPIHCTPMTHNAVIWLLEAIAHLHGSYIKYFKITSPIIFDIVPKVFQTKSNLKKKLSANEHFSADSCGWDKNIQMVRVTLKLPSFVSCHCNSKCIIVYIKIPQ